MEIVSLRCNHCGAPLEVGAATHYVVCQFCHSQLAVKRSGSSAYTEVLGKIARQTEQMAVNLKVIELQNELERLDRKWLVQRDAFYETRKYGGRQRPNRMAVVLTACGAILVILFWLTVADRMKIPGFFFEGGLVALGIFLIQGFLTFHNASSLEAAEKKHEAARSELVQRLDAARNSSAPRS